MEPTNQHPAPETWAAAPGSVPADNGWLAEFPAGGLLIDATRQCFGRRTIGATMHALRLARTWPRLPENTREIIRRDLTRHFELDDLGRRMRERDGKDHTLPLGEDCDRAAWEEVRAAWLAEDSRVEAPNGMKLSDGPRGTCGN